MVLLDPLRPEVSGSGCASSCSCGTSSGPTRIRSDKDLTLVYANTKTRPRGVNWTEGGRLDRGGSTGPRGVDRTEGVDQVLHVSQVSGRS